MADQAVSKENYLLVFARYPEKNLCKTRLADEIGPNKALRIYLALLQHTLSVAISTDYYRCLAVTPDDKAAEGAIWAGGMDAYYPQGDGGLGDRLQRAAIRSFSSLARKTVIIGTDCPQISKKILDLAFQALDEVDVVLGPAWDGGYYLIGFRSPNPNLFAGIDWSTNQVLNQTLNILKTHLLSYILLEKFRDVDTLDDFIKLKDIEPLKILGID